MNVTFTTLTLITANLVGLVFLGGYLVRRVNRQYDSIDKLADHSVEALSDASDDREAIESLGNRVAALEARVAIDDPRTSPTCVGSSPLTPPSPSAIAAYAATTIAAAEADTDIIVKAKGA